MDLKLKITQKEGTSMSSLVKQMCALKCRIKVDTHEGDLSIEGMDDNNVENVIDSIDEAFIDLTTYLNYYKMTAKELTSFIINEIKRETGLQATGGIGDNFFLAKVALDIFAKSAPDGIATMHIDDVKEKLWPITPLSKIWGIGPRGEAHLNKLGIYNVGQLANAKLDMMRREFGIMGEQLVEHANGIDNSDLHEEYVPKETSLTNGQTLFRDFTIEETKVLIAEMCDDLAAKLRSQNQLTSVVSIYIGYSSNLGGFHHQMALFKPTSDTDVLKDALLQLFDKYKKNMPVRNVSINFGKLEDDRDYEQLDIFTDAEKIENERNLQKVIDEIHNKYGKNILTKAVALTDSSTIIERHKQIGGHKK